MTARRVVMTSIQCDAEDCEVALPFGEADATAARLLAAREGWGYATFLKRNTRGGHGVSRADYCPRHTEITVHPNRSTSTERNTP